MSTGARPGAPTARTKVSLWAPARAL